ncbi:MAG TPA: hypothetical protein VGC71_13510 [Gaiellales bacterium]
MIAAAGLVVVGGAAVVVLAAGRRETASSSPRRAAVQAAEQRPAKPTVRVHVTRLGRLGAPLQDAAVAVRGDRVFVFGGLDMSGTSTGAISEIAGSSISIAGRLPVPVHDAAAAQEGGSLYIVGGGRATSAPGIARFSPMTGTTRLVGVLPTPLSDLTIASVSGTPYVIGGYTGAVWSDRIYALSGGHVHLAGRLPVALRYAAAATVGQSIIIAGGRTTAGPARAIYRFTPRNGRIERIGRLPHPLMHAAAGTLDGMVYVVGGLRRDGRPARSIVAIHPDGSTSRAGRLPTSLSDAAVATLPGRLLVVGGSNGARPTSSVLQVTVRVASGRPRAPAPAAPLGQKSAPPKLFAGPLPGDLLIADRGNNRVLLVNPRGHVLWRFPNRHTHMRLVFDDDTFFTPGGRSIISNEEENHKIVEVAYPSGRLLWSYGHAGVRGAAPGYLDTPDDAYKLRGGRVIVADAYNCRVLELRGRRIVRSIGQAGRCVHDPPRSLGPVNGDTPLPGGRILVSEIAGSYIDEFTRTGRLVRVYRAPVAYPSDPQLTRRGNILLADYTDPGGIVILSRRTGRLLWSYRPSSGRGRLDHPSLAAMLPNGLIAVTDDYNSRIVIIDPRTRRIVWHYGHRGRPGRGRGYLDTPDGFDFVPVSPRGAPDPAAIARG